MHVCIADGFVGFFFDVSEVNELAVNNARFQGRMPVRAKFSTSAVVCDLHFPQFLLSSALLLRGRRLRHDATIDIIRSNVLHF